MTSYRAQAEISTDGQIWQAVEPSEVVDIGTTTPENWFDARECATEIGAVAGSRVRILVWPADYEGYGTDRGTVHIDYHDVPVSA